MRLESQSPHWEYLSGVLSVLSWFSPWLFCISFRVLYIVWIRNSFKEYMCLWLFLPSLLSLFKLCEDESVSLSCLSLCNLMACSPPGSCPSDSPGKNTGVGCHALLQGIFPTWGLNPGLTPCRQILYRLEPPGKPVRMAILNNTGDGMNVIDKREEGMRVMSFQVSEVFECVW